MKFHSDHHVLKVCVLDIDDRDSSNIVCQVTDNDYSDQSPGLPLGVDRVCYGFRGYSCGVTQGGGTRVTRSFLMREKLFSCTEIEEDTEHLQLEEGMIKDEDVRDDQSGISLPIHEHDASELNLGRDASQ